MKIAYEHWDPEPDSQEKVKLANEILEEYVAQGYQLTLRQLYYQFVARGRLPNDHKEYLNLNTCMKRARMAGLVDWDHIVDRTRNLQVPAHWAGPADFIDPMAYREDKWATQGKRIEIWVEKDAALGVAEAVGARYDCPVFSCHGFDSTTEVWETAQRIERYLRARQQALILYCGDHDPSGLRMPLEITERLSRMIVCDDYRGRWPLGYQWILEGNNNKAIYLGQHGKEGALEVRRVALTKDQVRQYNPPPQEVKVGDTRTKAYRAEHGDYCWELEALPPQDLEALILIGVEEEIDQEAWDAAVAEESRNREVLEAARQALEG